MSTVKRLNTSYTIDTTEVIITGNLIIQGSQTSVESIDTQIKDRIITLNSGEAGSGVTLGTSGLEIDRGLLSNVSLLWNEGVDQWQITTDGVTYSNVLSSSYDTLTVGQLYLSGNVISSTGNILINPQNAGILQIIGTDAVGIPSGNSIQRPSNPEVGYFRYNTDTLGIEYWDGTIWAHPSNQSSDVIFSQVFHPNGAANTFTLSNTATSDTVIVSINGIVQIPTTSYSVSGYSLIFTEAPFANSNVEVRHLASGIGIVDWATRMSVANTAPIAETPNVGDLWWSPPDFKLYVYESASWVSTLSGIPDSQTAGSANVGYLRYSGTTPVVGQLYGGNTTPDATTRLNYDGNFYASSFVANTSVTAANVVSTGNLTVSSNINATTVNATNIAATAITAVTSIQSANIVSTGNMSSSGNVTASTFYGDGSQLSGVMILGSLTAQTAGNTNIGYLRYSGTTRTSGQIYGGTTNPSGSTRLNYDGYLYATKYFGDGANLTGISTGTIISDDVTTDSTFYPTFYSNTSGTTSNLSVSSTNLTFNPNSGSLSAIIFNALSDEKLKTDITTITGATATICDINGVEFSWISNNRKSAGIIAQQLEPILPHLVDEVNEFKNVNYLGIIAYLIESIKELNNRIIDLEHR